MPNNFDAACALVEAQRVVSGDASALRVVLRTNDRGEALSYVEYTKAGLPEAPESLSEPVLYTYVNTEDSHFDELAQFDSLREAITDLYGNSEGSALPECLQVPALLLYDRDGLNGVDLGVIDGWQYALSFVGTLKADVFRRAVGGANWSWTWQFGSTAPKKNAAVGYNALLAERIDAVPQPLRWADWFASK